MPARAPDLREIATAFAVKGVWRGAQRDQSGHINETYVATYERDGCTFRYVHQAINERIFRDIPALMQNVARITAHLRARAERAPAGRRWEVPTLVPSREGELFWRSSHDRVWRTFECIEGARAFDVAPETGVVREVARAFGRFACELVDFDPGELVESIPGFHDLPGRLARLWAAVEEDPLGRVAAVAAELDAIRARADTSREWTELREAGELPVRVAHNDTKVNNALIDESTGHGIAVIDLDTVMPGTILLDYGDLVRTATCWAAEDETDLSRVVVDPSLFQAVTEGYLCQIGSFLTPVERAHLLLGGRYMMLILAVRFLTDHLEGDTYFRLHRPGQNLDRARVQLKLLASLEGRATRFQEVLEKAARR